MAKPNKLKIVAYTKPDFSAKKPDPSTYTVRVNPESYTHGYTIQYDKTAVPGGVKTDVKFDGIPPETIGFKLLFDATGVIENSPTDLHAEIAAFRSVVYDYSGDIHSPYYLKIYWGKLAFGARLTALSLTYTLFTPDGAPLRATADASFVGQVDAATAQLQKANKSPDMTHHLLVRAGDTLPMMTFRVYGDTRYYLEVARQNNLTDFRNLKPGTTLQFPPLS